MKIKLSFLLFLFSIVIFAQNTLFLNTVEENILSSQQKIHKDLAATYLFTKYYQQSSFDLKNDLDINLPTNRNIKAKLIKTFVYSNKSESYVYRIENETRSELVLSKAGNAITGMYISATGEKIIFHQLNNNLFAVSVVNEVSLSSKDASGDDTIADGVSQKINSNVCLATTPVCAATTIDVLIVYTAAASAAWGGIAQSNSFAATAITGFNTALINSGVNNTTINLVYSGQIDYGESGSLSTDLTRFRNTTDGFMDDVHLLRSTYGADVCALVTSTPTNTCGLGYVNTNPTNYSGSNAFSATLFNCVVSNFSLAHEMGHNMGLRHDWFVDSSTSPCDHHHGYTNQTAIALGTSSTSSQRWRTIMAYIDECSNVGIGCTRINRWANPNVNFNGEPTGVPIGNFNPSDEAFGFSRFSCVVSQFMPSANLGTFEIKNTEVKDFTIYPNPAKDIINVWIKNDEIYTFKVINVLGQVVLTAQTKTINLKGLVPGEYFLSVYTDKNSFVGSKKFIVK